MRCALALLIALLFAPVAHAERAPRLYSELRDPIGTPRGTVLVIHGGGWTQVGAPTVQYEAGEADRLTSYGWRTLNVDYRPGKLALRDVIAWYDHARATWPGPMCAFGRSAGANLALLLAASRPSLRCVIGHGAITDLSSAYPLQRDYIYPSFGRRQRTLRFYSPLFRRYRPSQHLLLATSAADSWAPCAKQLTPFVARYHFANAYCLPRGDASFMHANVAAAAIVTQHKREKKILALVSRSSPYCLRCSASRLLRP